MSPWPSCECGCGQPVPAASTTNARLGRRRGDPLRFVSGHNHASSPVKYVVDGDTGCWVWQRHLNPQTGYAGVTVNGKRTSAHRWYYEQAHGPIPDGLHIDHLCRNRACVNPDHLEPVTIAENNLRGWQARGKTWPDETILRALRDWSKANGGESPTRNAWNADGCAPSSHTIKRRFGSWNAALVAAGLAPNQQGGWRGERKAA